MQSPWMKLILTIVGSVIPLAILAAPQRGEIPLDDATEMREAKPNPPPLEKTETVDIHNPPLSGPEKNKPAPELRYLYKNAMGLKAALLVRGRDENNKLELPHQFGVFYRGTLWRSQEVEYSLSLVSDAHGLLEIEPIFYFSRNLLRTYAKAGIAVALNPSELLPTLGRIQNYGAQVALGLEDLLHTPLSVKAEIGLRASTERTETYLLIGYSWAW